MPLSTNITRMREDTEVGVPQMGVKRWGFINPRIFEEKGFLFSLHFLDFLGALRT